MPSSFTANRAGVRAVFSASGPAGRHLVALAQRVQRGAEARMGVKTGELRDSGDVTFAQRGSESVATLTYTAPHALVHHEGSRPHVILPRNGRFLVFPGRKGETVFARKVAHPGTKPNRYLLDALDDIRGG